MKPIVAIFLALILVACAAPAPTSTGEQATSVPPEPTQTAVVVVETVVEKVVETVIVTVIPTQAPTEEVVQVTQPPAQPVAAAADTGGLITVDNVLGAGWFVEMTRTRNDFALRCQLSRDITFSVKPADPNITRVDFYYRIEDRATGSVFDWQNAGRMFLEANGNFTLVFSGENVSVNFRKPNAWFDYQFIGLSRSGGVVGRSEKIVQQVSYTFDCP